MWASSYEHSPRVKNELASASGMVESVDRLHMPFYTQYRTNVFLLKMQFTLNELPIKVSLSTTAVSGQSQPSLKLGSGEYKDIPLSAVQRDIDHALRSKSNAHVGSYHCEQKDSWFVPVFEVVFPNESCLNRFLKNQKDLVIKFERRIKKRLANKSESQILLVKTRFTVQLELYFAITSPKSARRVILVNGENSHLCMQSYLKSCAFSISDLFQVETTTPITLTELDELMSALHSIMKWFMLGLKFDVSVTDLNNIQDNSQWDVERRKREMLTVRLNQTNSELTWQGIVNVLKEMDENVLALEIAQKYGIVCTWPVDAATAAINLEDEVQAPNMHEEKEQEREKHIQELRKQIKEQKFEAQEKEDELKILEDQIAKLEEQKESLIKEQQLSTSLRENNVKLQEAILKKDEELREVQGQCTKLKKDLKETKKKLYSKMADVEKLQTAVKSLKQSLEVTEKTSKTTQDYDLKLNSNQNLEESHDTQINFPSTSNDDIKPKIPTVKATIKFFTPPSLYTTTGTEQRIHFIIETQSTDTNDLRLNPSAQLRLLGDTLSQPVQIKREYEAIYTSDKVGIHMLDVYINEDLAGSQRITVYPNPVHRLLPFKSILFKDIVPSEFKDTDIDSKGRLWIAQSQCVSVVDSMNNSTLHPRFEHEGIVSVSIDEHDNVFVIADYDLIRIDSRGNIIETKQRKSKKNYHPPSKVQAHQDKVYVYFKHYSRIWVYDSDLHRIGTMHLDNNIFDFELDRNENVIYVMTKNNIQVLTLPNGELKRAIQIPCNYASNPQKFCVAGSYIYAIEKSLNVIVVLTMSGEFIKYLKQRDGVRPYRVSAGRTS